MAYKGYLAGYQAEILLCSQQGFHALLIAERLYDKGVRSPNLLRFEPHASRDRHVSALTGIVRYVINSEEDPGMHAPPSNTRKLYSPSLRPIMNFDESHVQSWTPEQQFQELEAERAIPYKR